MYARREAKFFFRPRFKGMHAVGAFNDEYVWLYGRDFCLYEMAIFLARVVTSV